MKLPSRLLLSSVVLLAAVPLRAEVRVVAGEPATVHVSEPFSIDFTTSGDMFGVEFTKSNRIFRLASGKLDFIAGVQHNAEDKGEKKSKDVHDGADPLKAVFTGMHDLQITRDNQAIIGDSFQNRVRQMDLASGKVSTIAGTGASGFSGDGGPAAAATFSITMTATLTPDQKGVLIADIGNNRVRRIDLASGKVSTIAGNGKKGNPADGASALEAPMGDARAVTQAADGTVYVLLRGGNSLVQIKDGKVRTVVNASGKKGYSGDGGPGRDATMNGPKYIITDRDNNVIICDTENHCVRRWSVKTEKIELLAGAPPKTGKKVGNDYLHTELCRPHGVRFGPDGKLYIADTYNNRVLCGEYK